MSKTSRETIQISLGSSANAVTAHLLNLQGLAATTAQLDDNDESYCDPLVTHTVSQQHGQQLWVPRVLMVDEGMHRVPESPHVDNNKNNNNNNNIISNDHYHSNLLAAHNASTSTVASGGTAGSIPWTGTITSLSEDLSLFGTGTGNGNGRGGSSSSYDDPFWKAASTLAYSPYSRYHVRGHDAASGASSYRSMTTVRADPDQPRHVIWDDENDEEEEEEKEQEEKEQEDPEEMARRKRRAWNQWNTETAVPLRQQLTESALSARRPSQEAEEEEEQRQQRIGWRDIWMPPRLETSILTLPYSQQSQLVAHWEESYNGDNEASNGTRRAWTEDVLLESLRHLLEACDGCQGVSITTQGQGIYAGLSNVLLEELQEECKSAGRIVYHVPNPIDAEKTSLGDVKEDSAEQSSPSWQEANVRRVRTQIGAGLALHDFAEKAHLVLPLRLDHGDAGMGGIFRSSARMAVALEAASLPMRFRGGSTRNTSRQPRHSVGLQNAPFFGLGGDDVRWGTTASRLTFAEYIGMLRPSSSNPMLELDALVTSDATTNNELRMALLQGTGIERDERMRQSGEDGFRRRPQETLPGAWLQDITTPSGLLSSLSCSPEIAKTVADRSTHHHFALSTAVRPVLLHHNDASFGTSTALSDYLSCLIQGMGVMYRPERSMCTVLDQTVGQLTLGGDGAGYGAGAYWRHLLPSSIDSPVVAVLGNTTRSYASLRATATDMKSAMGTRYRGYVNRDVMNGVLPEREDVEEALARAWDLCDAYYPPSGNRFETDENGEDYS